MFTLGKVVFSDSLHVLAYWRLGWISRRCLGAAPSSAIFAEALFPVVSVGWPGSAPIGQFRCRRTWRVPAAVIYSFCCLIWWPCWLVSSLGADGLSPDHVGLPE